ncbi:Hypp8938 [Branchiostoma lanceolatum]|uniref:Hypp8938 protein n=1 Tax=Branchiostoma lanceolatum TaxID=7740 RepID=A0A8J9ZC24_BRALA|nr:Hypp8938 [Branchiostoma lanceolatum]
MQLVCGTINLLLVLGKAASMPNSSPTTEAIRLAEDPVGNRTRRVSVEKVSSRAARIAWGDGSTGVDGFSRMLYHDLADEWRLQKHVMMKPEIRSYVLVNLKPRTKYEVCVFDPKFVHPPEVDCVTFKTKDDSEAFEFRVKAWGIVGGIGLFLLLVGAVYRVVVRYQKKRRNRGDNANGANLITVSDQLAREPEESTSDGRERSTVEILSRE